jgi:hypothetical protein
MLVKKETLANLAYRPFVGLCATLQAEKEKLEIFLAPYLFVSKVAAQAVVWPICVISSFCLSRKFGWHFFFEKRNNIEIITDQQTKNSDELTSGQIIAVVQAIYY